MTVRRLAAAALVLAAAASCGKRGNPLPPLRPVPGRVADLSAARSAQVVELRFTVPAANIDGTTPVALDRVEIYGVFAPLEAPPPLAAAISGDVKNLRGSQPVRAASTAQPTTGPSAPAPGDRAVVADRAADLQGAPAGRMYYVAVPVVGGGRGRRGPLSAPVAVPMGSLPSPPASVALDHDERDVRVTWQASETAGRSYRVVRTTAAGAPVTEATPLPLATAPLASFPVEFGRQVCVTVSTIETAGTASVEGAPSAPACVVPVDRYAPPSPTGLQVVQDGTAVTLVWNAVDASDLSGYIVLRGTGEATTLQPLMRTPVRETTYRDTAVASGATYTYAVYAVDTASTPNVSQLSGRQTVTVR